VVMGRYDRGTERHVVKSSCDVSVLIRNKYGVFIIRTETSQLLFLPRSRETPIRVLYERETPTKINHDLQTQNEVITTIRFDLRPSVSGDTVPVVKSKKFIGESRTVEQSTSRLGAGSCGRVDHIPPATPASPTLRDRLDNARPVNPHQVGRQIIEGDFMVDRNAKFKLTNRDIAAVNAAILDDRQGVVRDDGSL